VFEVNLDTGIDLNKLAVGRFKSTCSHLEDLGLKVCRHRPPCSDVCDGECKLRVFSHCYCHLRSEPKFESLGLFIKRLRAISLDGSLVNIRNLKGPPSAGGTT